MDSDSVLPRGNGKLVLAHGDGPGAKSSFTTLTASYPLKLLAPHPLPSTPPHVGVCYSLAYGGGLVAGDEISLEVEVGARAGLLMLTQGSTKVFRTRPGKRPLSLGRRSDDGTGHVDNKTVQRLHVNVGPGGFLLLLPSAIQPYADSDYHQAQRVVLADPTASCIILDSVTAGRTQQRGRRGISEDWDFQRYSSLNEVVTPSSTNTAPGAVDVLMRERTVLEEPHQHSRSPSTTTRRHSSSHSTSSHRRPSRPRRPRSPSFDPNDPSDPDAHPAQFTYSHQPHTIDEDCPTEPILPTDVPLHPTHLSGQPNEPVAETSPSASHSPETSRVPLPTEPLSDRMHPYKAYATVLISGPHMVTLLDTLEHLRGHESQVQWQSRGVQGQLVWSFSRHGKVLTTSSVDEPDFHTVSTSQLPTDPASDTGKQLSGVLRVAALETELVGDFVRAVLEQAKIDELVGKAVWERIW